MTSSSFPNRGDCGVPAEGAINLLAVFLLDISDKGALAVSDVPRGGRYREGGDSGFPSVSGARNPLEYCVLRENRGLESSNVDFHCHDRPLDANGLLQLAYRLRGSSVRSPDLYLSNGDAIRLLNSLLLSVTSSKRLISIQGVQLTRFGTTAVNLDTALTLRRLYQPTRLGNTPGQ